MQHHTRQWIGVALALCGCWGCDSNQQHQAGRVLFDSNRSGTFGIYSMAMDGSDIRVVADSPEQEMTPDPSPDGRWIVYARAKSLDRKSESEIRICARDGSQDRLLVADGTFPRFHPETGRLYFVRGRSQIMIMDPDRPQDPPTRLYPHSTDDTRQVLLPALSPNGEWLAFTTDAPLPWYAVVANLETGDEMVVGRGCEPSWIGEGDQVMWICSRDTRERTGILAYDFQTRKRRVIQDEDAPWGHEYFPSLDRDHRILLWSVCPAGTHSHNSANYQIFTRPWKGGEVKRLTHDRFTNRWPKLLPPAGGID